MHLCCVISLQGMSLGRPTDVPDTGVMCDLLWTDPDKDITGWAENDRGVSFIPRQVVEDGYEFLAKHRADDYYRRRRLALG